MRASQALKLGVVALGLAVVLFISAAVLGTRAAPERPLTGSRTVVSAPGEVANPGNLAAMISALQTRLERLPTDAESWSALGSAYIQQARVTGDPSYFAKAEGALRRSLEERPAGNSGALTGEAALAAGQHDFTRALALARRSKRINRFSSSNEGMMVDALVELGRYPAATRAAQRMVDLKPAVPSYTRASYIFELRGDLAGARFAMHRALDVAYSDDDKAFALFQLGELAWNAGHLRSAGRLYAEGRRLDPSYVPLLYGTAKVRAAQGRTASALRLFSRVVHRYPAPTYLVEFVDQLTAVGRTTQARKQERLLRAQQQIFRAAHVNLDLELALYEANYGDPGDALRSAARAYRARQSVFVEDAYAWALHVNGRDHGALVHSRNAARLGTRSALFAFHRGEIERSLGMWSAARSSLERSLAINPYFSPVLVPQAEQALHRLQTRR